MLQVIEVGSVESTGPLWSVSIVQAPVIVVLVAVTTHRYSEINFIISRIVQCFQLSRSTF